MNTTRRENSFTSTMTTGKMKVVTVHAEMRHVLAKDVATNPGSSPTEQSVGEFLGFRLRKLLVLAIPESFCHTFMLG